MKASSKETVVYILGAGFSAQYGLPVMSNFLEKSKDLFAEEGLINEKIRDFDAVYRRIDRLRKCKDYYNADLTNIEEILSLFDMDALASQNSKCQHLFKNFICEIIKHFTPSAGGEITDFVRMLLRSRNIETEKAEYDDSQCQYYVLSFNYDMLLENGATALETSNQNTWRNGSLTPVSAIKDIMVKLHGSADQPESIVAPTWRKTFYESSQSDQSQTETNWKKAGKILASANHIRIIGYSLPITDSYFKYFLKWGASQQKNLKTIDVICRDPDGCVATRYRDFVISSKLKFFNVDTAQYFARNGRLLSARKSDTLEDLHDSFMRTHNAVSFK